MAKRWRNAILLAAVEDVSGTEQTITASTDAIMCENVQVTMGDSVQDTQEYTGSLDNWDGTPVSGPATITYTTYVKGSGTAGTAPVIGKLFRGCSWAETLSAAALPTTPITITGTASGMPVVNETDFGGADDAYVGMPIQLRNVPATPTFALVKDFVASSNALTVSEIFSPAINLTTAVQIPANVRYNLHSSTLTTLTKHFYVDGIKHVFVGCAGTWSLSMVSGRQIAITWTFTGLFLNSGRSDTPNPTVTFTDRNVPKLTWRNDNSNGGFTLDGVRIGMSQLTFENGNQVTSDPNPNTATGFDIADITARNMVCTIDPLLASIGTRDMLTKLQDGQKVSVAAFARLSAGNSFGIIMPECQVVATPYGNRDGKVTEQLRLKPTGLDSGAYLCFF